MKKFFGSLIHVIMVLVAVCIVGFCAVGCTQNQMARNFGGEMKVDLPAGEKLVEATWKGDELWYLTRPMRRDEKPETFYFREKSSFGVMQGKITFVEHWGDEEESKESKEPERQRTVKEQPALTNQLLREMRGS